jgi:eukaryotic translation initiation factor 2C
LLEYNISLQHTDDLAIIDVGGPGRSNYIPAELCNIEPGEPHLGKVGPKETSDMLKVASRKPAENTAIIMENGLPRLGYKPSTSVLQSFNIHLASQMAIIPGRELLLPSVTYGKGTPRVQNGSWNILDVKFHHGAKMTNWKVLVMRDGMDAYSFSGPRDERLISFIKAFANKCRNSGMEVGNEPPHIVPTDQLPPEPTILVGIDVTLLGPAVFQGHRLSPASSLALIGTLCNSRRVCISRRASRR